MSASAGGGAASSSAPTRYAAGDRVFVLHPEHSWVVGVVKQVQLNPTYKPAYAAIPDHQRKREHSARWYQVGVTDSIVGECNGEVLPMVEEWRLDTFDDAIEARPVDDLLSLVHLNDAAILRTLTVRYFQDIIYTNIGVIVVAINPFNTNIPRYLDSRMQLYLAERGQTISEKLLPHSWAQAHNTYQELVTSNAGQSILISGESGAGKTEAAKIVLKYLSHVSVVNGTPQERAAAADIAKRISACSPILESFGNAKTVRNDNSSRFGKLLHLKFDPRTYLFSGARAVNYLLEKSRVTTCARNERIYHSFYLAAAAPLASTVLRLTRPKESYEALFRGGVLDNKEYSTTADYEEVSRAMQEVGINGVALESVWKIVSGILHMGNVKFRPDGEGSAVESAGGNATFLENACALWGVASKVVAEELVSTEIIVAGTSTRKLLPLHKAVDVRDALCKALYGSLFGWLVQQCNQSCDVSDSTLSIALLDIFGFECFEVNSFEQLCINFANEALQQHYNFFVFNKDLELCRGEGIDTIDFRCPDLLPTLQLIGGIFSALDDQCALNGSETALHEELCRKYHKMHPAFDRDITKRSTFAVVHFAGRVTYTLDTWIEKNRDTLKPVFRDSVFAVADPMENVLSSTLLVASPGDTTDGGASAPRKKSSGPPTVATSFREQMAALLQTIEATNPHWIRCIKPHPTKQPRMLSGSYTLRQLEFSGILGTVKIRKAGYPVRFRHRDFCLQFFALLPFPNREALEQGESNPGYFSLHAATLLRKCAIPTTATAAAPALAQLGKTLVFLKSEGFYEVERQRKNRLVDAAVVIQSAGRGHLRRHKVYQMRIGKFLQRVGRCYLAKRMLFHVYREAHAAQIEQLRREREEAAAARRAEERRLQLEAELENRKREAQRRAQQAVWEAAVQALDGEEESERQRLELDANAALREGAPGALRAAWEALQQRRGYEAFQRFLATKLKPVMSAFLTEAEQIAREEEAEIQLMFRREFPVRMQLLTKEGLRNARIEEARCRARLMEEYDDDVLFLSRAHEGACTAEQYRMRKLQRLARAQSDQSQWEATQQPITRTGELLHEAWSAVEQRTGSHERGVDTSLSPSLLRSLLETRHRELSNESRNGGRNSVQGLERPKSPCAGLLVRLPSGVTGRIHSVMPPREFGQRTPIVQVVVASQGSSRGNRGSPSVLQARSQWIDFQDVECLPDDFAGDLEGSVLEVERNGGGEACPRKHHRYDEEREVSPPVRFPFLARREEPESNGTPFPFDSRGVSERRFSPTNPFQQWKREMVRSERHVASERVKRSGQFQSWRDRVALLEEED